MVGSVLSGIKLSKVASGGVNNSASEFSVGFYTVTSISDTSFTDLASGTYNIISPPPVMRVAGPGQNLPSTFTSVYQCTTTQAGTDAFTEGTITYTLQSGFVLINTP